MTGVRIAACTRAAGITIGATFICAVLIALGTVPTTPHPSAHLLTTLTAEFTPSEATGAWQGADATSSVQLRDGRLLFVFSDTLVGSTTDGVRNVSNMPHNPELSNAKI